jgi:signal peptide peptidase SppA
MLASPAAFAAALFDRPLALSPDAAGAACDVMDKVDFSAIAGDAAPRTEARPYVVDPNGVATIPIHGQLSNRPSWYSTALGFGSYQQVRAALAAAGADYSVKGVVLDVDSPGGDLAGCVETAGAVRALQARKPVAAFVDGLGASGAYIVAAGAGSVIVAPSATLGSIGIVWLHLDRSAAFAKRGVKPTLLHAGAFKVDGNSSTPLAPDARARIEAQLAQAHGLILASVGAHRPKLGVAGARKTEAGVYMGQAAVTAGLADSVGTFDDARAYITATPRSAPPPAAAAPPRPLSLGAHAMSTSTLPDKATALGAMLASGHLYPEDALIRASKKDQRRNRANALVAGQMGTQSAGEHMQAVADAEMKRRLPPGEFAKATASRDAKFKAEGRAISQAATVDDVWSDIIKGLGPSSALASVHR